MTGYFGALYDFSRWHESRDRQRYNGRMPGRDQMKPSPRPLSPDGAARQGVKLTYNDFLHFPDDGKRHELIDGSTM